MEKKKKVEGGKRGKKKTTNESGLNFPPHCLCELSETMSAVGVKAARIGCPRARRAGRRAASRQPPARAATLLTMMSLKVNWPLFQQDDSAN